MAHSELQLTDSAGRVIGRVSKIHLFQVTARSTYYERLSFSVISKEISKSGEISKEQTNARSLCDGLSRRTHRCAAGLLSSECLRVPAF